jgi:DNA invertase Pin-like site-specific DNA recombinase
MQIGYARSSTIDQEAGYKAQLKALKAAGCQKVFAEKVSSVAQRAELEAALDYAREGDALVVIKLDRLARSVAHLISIGERLAAKGVSLKVLEQQIDTSTPTGRLMFNMLGAIAQFERELMLEREREGVAKAKVEGKYKGSAPTARAKAP